MLQIILIIGIYLVMININESLKMIYIKDKPIYYFILKKMLLHLSDKLLKNTLNLIKIFYYVKTILKKKCDFFGMKLKC